MLSTCAVQMRSPFKPGSSMLGRYSPGGDVKIVLPAPFTGDGNQFPKLGEAVRGGRQRHGRGRPWLYGCIYTLSISECERPSCRNSTFGQPSPHHPCWLVVQPLYDSKFRRALSDYHL
ncbi:unnamed protein product [Arctogadus glacialis]